MKTLGQLLFELLASRGLDRTFGIPGDFVLPLYAAQQAFGMETVVCSHEPNAVYAADSYARIRGLGVALTTYGAGGLNMINPVAMAYAEYSPVLVISGAPDTQQRESESFLHHRVRDFDTQFRVYSEVTVDAAIIKSLSDAPAMIRVLDNVMRQHRPGYLEINRDLIPQALELDIKPRHVPQTASHKATVDECVNELDRLLRAAVRPLLYAGIGVRRNKLVDQLCRLAEGYGLEVVSSVLGKGSFPESHPNFRGMLMGELGKREIHELAQASDFVLKVGVLDTDVNTGFWTGMIRQSRLASVGERNTAVFHHRYENLSMVEVVQGLLVKLKEKPAAKRALPERVCEAAPNLSFGDAHKGVATPNFPGCVVSERLTQATIISNLKRLALDDFRVLADVGDCWFLGLELQVDEFLAPGYYASMGFAIPGALGAALADSSRRTLVLVGDGAFQMTANELGTLALHKLNPIIILLNNDGYQMLSALDQARPYYQIAPWNYSAVARAMGCEAWCVERASDFEPALKAALACDKPALIEARIAAEDRSPIMTRIQAFMAKKAKTESLAVQA